MTSRIRDAHINLSHGSGGKAMHALIDDVFLGAFGNGRGTMEDSATLPLVDMVRHGDRLAFTTDSYVVDPLFFPGADIGALAVAGTVNDLAVSGARPLFLSCGMVLEEGLPLETLRRVALSMRRMVDQRVVPEVGKPRELCPAGCDRALDNAIITATHMRDPALAAKLDAVAGRVLG